ncbi:DUF4351 domain-containing protein [Sorangium sp. So ce448]|uniref:DUF4351 domain-containing protein n=1 Tax=Sorangium sp. So ce448 TaxID=3133314 RepID=UPI003F60E2FE
MREGALPEFAPLSGLLASGDVVAFYGCRAPRRRPQRSKHLGSGRVLREALADLAAMPEDAWERSVATPLLVHFQLGLDEQATSEEDDVSAEIRAWFEDYQQKLRNEGLKEGERNLLLRLLRARFGELPAAVVARIDAADVAELERWGDRVLAARTLDEVLGAPS